MPRKKKSEPVVAAPQEVVTAVTESPKQEAKAQKPVYKVKEGQSFRDKHNFDKQYSEGDIIEGWEEERLKSAIERGLVKLSE